MHTPFQSDIVHSCCCCCCCWTGESHCSLSHSHHFINNNLVSSHRQIVSLTISLNWASQVRAVLALAQLQLNASTTAATAPTTMHTACFYVVIGNVCALAMGIVLNVGCRHHHHKHFLQIIGASRSAAASAAAAAAGDNPASKQTTTTTEWSILMECECSPCKVILLVRRKDGWMDENSANRQTSSLTHSLTQTFTVLKAAAAAEERKRSVVRDARAARAKLSKRKLRKLRKKLHQVLPICKWQICFKFAVPAANALPNEVWERGGNENERGEKRCEKAARLIKGTRTTLTRVRYTKIKTSEASNEAATFIAPHCSQASIKVWKRQHCKEGKKKAAAAAAQIEMRHKKCYIKSGQQQQQKKKKESKASSEALDQIKKLKMKMLVAKKHIDWMTQSAHSNSVCLRGKESESTAMTLLKWLTNRAKRCRRGGKIEIAHFPFAYFFSLLFLLWMWSANSSSSSIT